MDRSMDSIGSCSLDVDADSSDISDTSGSLNFPTPLSVKDITREFTANIRERCTVRSTTVIPQSTTAIVDPVSGQVRMVLTQPTPPTTTTTTTSSYSYSHSNGNSNTAESGSAIDSAASSVVVVGTAAAAQAAAAATVTIIKPTTATSTVAASAAAATGSGGGGGGGGAGSGGGSEKKPSYLNLACCVNGYSNLTTYDSKIRQDINKSREVSPIRPSSQALQYCKKNNALAPPVLHAMPNVSVTTQPLAGAVHKYNSNNTEANNNNNNNGSGNGLHYENVNGNSHGHGNGVCDGDEQRRNASSFIQQRVERLYGPGALAQGFYSPKKIRSTSALRASETSPQSSELSRKFQQLSPSKDYTEFRKKLGGGGGGGGGSAPNSARQTVSSDHCAIAAVHAENNNIDLPCLRHLSQEFRAQLPSISPKRHVPRSSPPRQEENGHLAEELLAPVVAAAATASTATDNTPSVTCASDEIDHTVPHPMESLVAVDDEATLAHVKHSTSIEITLAKPNENNTQSQTQILAALATTPSTAPEAPAAVTTPVPAPSLEVALPVAAAVVTKAIAADTDCTTNGVAEKDGNYFLQILKNEQARLLALASVAEKYTDALANNPEITEDTLGFLRSASGKARLLVSQKMKQFEGLCHNNLNRSPEDKFPTTVDDLQGFWDMVHLQVDHIDSIFAEIEVLKSNDWKKLNAAAEVITPRSTPQHKSTKTGVNQRTTTRAAANGAAGSASASKSSKTSMSAAALKRESQRKQLLEMKRKNRMAMASANVAGDSGVTVVLDNANSIEIFGNEKSS